MLKPHLAPIYNRTKTDPFSLFNTESLPDHAADSPRMAGCHQVLFPRHPIGRDAQAGGEGQDSASSTLDPRRLGNFLRLSHLLAHLGAALGRSHRWVTYFLDVVDLLSRRRCDWVRVKEGLMILFTKRFRLNAR